MLSGSTSTARSREKARFTFYAEHSPRTQAMTKRFVNDRDARVDAPLLGDRAEAGMAPVTLAVAWSLAHDYVGSTIIGATEPA